MDFLLNGQGYGSVASRLMEANFDPNVLRPYFGPDGRSYITANVGTGPDGKPKYAAIPTNNASTTLRVREWIDLDTAVIKAARQRLRAVADLRAAGLTYGIADGMGKTVLQTERQSNITPATLSMDGLRKGENDRPLYDLTNLPLPIIHKDFQISARQLVTSRNGGSPLDTSMAELAARRCGELAEQLLIGNAPGTLDQYAYGGGTVYGYTDFPQRITKTMTIPTGAGWTPAATIDELLDMKLQSQLAFHYGPWRLYNSPNWDKFLDGDYSAAKGDNTLRDRIAKIDGISPPSTLDFLTGYQMLLVQQTTDVVREVIGMDFTTMQWETDGGLMINFKILGILVPQIRADYNGNTGIVHGTAT